MKLKIWGYEKYLSSADKKNTAAKPIKRTRDEGENASFFHTGAEIQPDRIECFKRRKMANIIEVVIISKRRQVLQSVCKTIQQILTDQQKIPQT